MHRSPAVVIWVPRTSRPRFVFRLKGARKSDAFRFHGDVIQVASSVGGRGLTSC